MTDSNSPDQQPTIPWSEALKPAKTEVELKQEEVIDGFKNGIDRIKQGVNTDAISQIDTFANSVVERYKMVGHEPMGLNEDGLGGSLDVNTQLALALMDVPIGDASLKEESLPELFKPLIWKALKQNLLGSSK